MKIIVIIFIIINFIYINNGYEYINFIPYIDNICSISSSTFGVGFSLVANTCFSFDNLTNHLIEIRNDEYSIYMSSYYDILGSTSCQSPIEGTELQFQIGSCVVADLQSTFTFNSLINQVINNNSNSNNNNNFQGQQQLFYYKIIKSEQPIIQVNSFVTSFMSDECDLESSIIISQYILNGTQIEYGSESNIYNFYCNDENQPFTQFCPLTNNNKCLNPVSASLTCWKTIPFFNSTTDIFDSSLSGNIDSSSINSGSGGSNGPHNSITNGGIHVVSSSGYSSTGTGITSGGGGTGNSGSSGTGSNSDSGGSSGGELFYSNHNIHRINTSPKLESSSSTSGDYYKSVYCTPK